MRLDLLAGFACIGNGASFEPRDEISGFRLEVVQRRSDLGEAGLGLRRGPGVGQQTNRKVLPRAMETSSV